MYTAISFAPVQGFIEKSRKLRDLFGASLILSHLSHCLIQWAIVELGEDSLISPALIDNQKGTPNRILLRGELSQEAIAAILLEAWGVLLEACRKWIEEQPSAAEYTWEDEWNYWKRHTWEVFWGRGETIALAMRDLEARKLQRNWVAVNWVGESSSLSGSDAIAWPGLSSAAMKPKLVKSQAKEQSQGRKEAYQQFYRQLAWSIEHPGAAVADHQNAKGGFIDETERLSIPELTKRLVTLPTLAKQLKIPCPDRFNDTKRRVGEWTGWFMGDGDQVGDYLNRLAASEGDRAIQSFSQAMRQWGKSFEQGFPANLGRVIYAGGDDFLGSIYADENAPMIQPQEAITWLYSLPERWQQHEQPINFSLGFVWAGHSVPQRDILQHCREAEKRSKLLGRNRITIRILFNSGQYVQWTCPWDYLQVLQLYRDRDGKQNWAHIYNDWAYLKARHVVPSDLDFEQIDDRLALALVDRYFDFGQQHTRHYHIKMSDYLTRGYADSHDRQPLVGDDSPKFLIDWIDGLVHVGWQLCSNS
jgi:CRISPR-associated protein Cmr2